MSAESVKVIVRARPLNQKESDAKCRDVLEIHTEAGQCSIKHGENKNDKKDFFFDGAYGSDSKTEQLYDEIASPLVDGVTKGYNATIFAYGQTGCGKSFTMQGNNELAGQDGIIPRAFAQIFETISVSQDAKYLVHVSYLEIYNEEVMDLLSTGQKSKVEIKEHPEKGVFVSGLSLHKVKNAAECQNFMTIGLRRRATGATLMNADSSRSHSIFTIYVEQLSSASNGGGDSGRNQLIKAGKLNLVDLAGSERQAKTAASGDRLKEATKINLSLSALGNVISALVDAKVKHIPYRDSKLTRLLQDSLGGNTKTLMIACLSPADVNYDETLSTLRYANRAKNIKNKPKVNEDPKDALIRQYQAEIEQLQKLLVKERQSSGGQLRLPTPPPVEEARFSQEVRHHKEELQRQYESKLKALQDRCFNFETDKRGLEEEIDRLRASLASQDKRSMATTSIQAQIDKAVSISELNETLVKQRPVDVGNSHQPLIGECNNTGGGGASVRKTSLTTCSCSRPNTTTTAFESNNTSSTVTSSLTGTSDQLLDRLHTLQSNLVGGEARGDSIQASAIESRQLLRLQRAEMKQRRIVEALKQLDDDQSDNGDSGNAAMLGIYESMQDALHRKMCQLESQKRKYLTLQLDLKDIQSEFEQDRCDYLDTIRRQHRHIDLLAALLDRLQPCVRRDCNYYHLEKIKRQAKYSEESGEWTLPALTVTASDLPNPLLVNASTPSSFDHHHSRRRPRSSTGGAVDPSSSSLPGSSEITVSSRLPVDPIDDRLYAKLQSRAKTSVVGGGYAVAFNRRAKQLLIDAATINSNIGGPPRTSLPDPDSIPQSSTTTTTTILPGVIPPQSSCSVGRSSTTSGGKPIIAKCSDTSDFLRTTPTANTRSTDLAPIGQQRKLPLTRPSTNGMTTTNNNVRSHKQ